MGIRRHNIVPFSRDYRKARKFDMGLPNGRGPKRRWIEWKVVAGALLVFFLAGPPFVDLVNGLITDSKGCRVWSVTDGDTVRLWCPTRGIESGRLLGFDTPEYKSRCLSELALAVAATFELRGLLWGASEISAQTQGTDRYGRSLTRLTVDGRDAADAMIASGLARPYEGGQRDGWCG